MTLLKGGVDAFVEYLSLHVLTCLVPAFFIAGAISVFASQSAILKYFGPQANKGLSYGIASVSGAVLAVCSCTILPLFGGIYKRGAGLGPAIAFLYSGPAINVLAIIYTARVLGFDIGIARAAGAILFALIIGLTMALIFRRSETGRLADMQFAVADPEDGKKWWQILLYFAVLVGILVVAALGNWIATGILVLALLVILWRWFTKQEIIQWLKATTGFIKMILPWLLGGIFIAGVIGAIPGLNSAVGRVVGGNSIQANLIASFTGALFYFATLTEVPILSEFMKAGMGQGPALALLLAGPAISIPNMLVLRNIMGTKRTLVYISLTVIMATFCGLLFGFIR